MSRGIQNYNPGNIRKSADKWQGLADLQDDPSFFTFKDATWGIRAMAIILIGYYDKDNLDTIAGIISRWAPPVENDTGSYISDVSRHCVFTADRKLNLHEYTDIMPLVKAIIWHENGELPYTDEVINAGLARAGIEIPKKPLYATAVIKGAAVAIVGSASGIGGTLIDNTPTLAQYVGTSHWMHLTCGILTSLGISLSIIGKVKDYGKSVTGGGV